MEFQQTVSGRD